jgi:N-acetylglucosamine kinase
MALYIGLDGGGTKTKCVLVDEEMNVLSEMIGGPSNFLVFGLDKVTQSLFNLITDCVKQADIDLSKIDSILLGTAGAGRRADAERLENSFIQKSNESNISINKFAVESDARIALEGAFSGESGSILIAGTGSIMFGKDSEGNIHRVGGFGRILGDEGSGFHIGRSGLTAIAKYFDGRGEKTDLAYLLKNKFNISDSHQLISEVYKNNIDIASVAPLVIEAAEGGDKICKEIIQNEVDQLLQHVESMKILIKEDELKISLIGGTITTDNYYAKLFKHKINIFDSVKITEPELEPAIGAALIAKNIVNT